MASDKYNFSVSGPKLKRVNWKKEHHKRFVAASLVQGVYTLEKDRKLKREGPEALAPPWWESFNFRLNRCLVDDDEIYGAVCEFNPRHPRFMVPNESPRYVVAFRGTILKSRQDLKLDVSIVCGTLHEESRLKNAIEEVREVVCNVENSKVWFVGHSLGAAFALFVGKAMHKCTHELSQHFLFNPPFGSISIVKMIIKDEELKDMIWFGVNVLKASLAKIDRHRNQSKDSFTDLSGWRPYLFVNSKDPICSKYIQYFKTRQQMEENGLGYIGNSASETSIRTRFFTALGKKSEPFHLIPSARLIINRNQNLLEGAHSISQWWKPDLEVKFESYEY